MACSQWFAGVRRSIVINYWSLDFISHIPHVLPFNFHIERWTEELPSVRSEKLASHKLFNLIEHASSACLPSFSTSCSTANIISLSITPCIRATCPRHIIAPPCHWNSCLHQSTTDIFFWIHSGSFILNVAHIRLSRYRLLIVRAKLALYLFLSATFATLIF